MLTYATVADFEQMKDFARSGVVASMPETSKDKIQTYLERATRFIDRFTSRRFFPYVETREYAIPYSFYDLQYRRFPMQHLKLDADLLEALTVYNGNAYLVENTQYYLLEANIFPKIMVAIKFPAWWGGFTTAYNVRYDEPRIQIKGVWGYADQIYPQDFWIDTQETVEVGGITDTQTVLTVTNTDGLDDWGKVRFSVGYMIRIDDELMAVSAVNTTDNEITVIRGYNGSDKVAHDEGVAIKRWRVVEDITEATLQVAKTWREADLAAGGRIGVSDMSAGAEIGIPADPLETIKKYKRSLIWG